MRLAISISIALATVAALEGAALAQTYDVGRGGIEVRWTGGCNDSITFTNATQRQICDLRIVQISPGVAPFLRRVRLEDGAGTWPVDDNMSGTVGEPAAAAVPPAPAHPNEQDLETETPGPVTRIEKGPGNLPPPPPPAPPPPPRPSGNCLPANRNFGLTLCGDDTDPATPPADQSVAGHRFYIIPTADSDGDIAMMPACAPDGSQALALATAYANPFGKYLLEGRPQAADGLAELTIASRDPDVQIAMVTTTPPGEFDAGSGRVFFAAPVSPETDVTVEIELTGASTAESFEIALSHCLLPTPPSGDLPITPVRRKPGCCQSGRGNSVLVAGIVLVAIGIRRRRRRPT